MAKGINKVILIGTLGKDVEVKTFGDGGSIGNVSLATSEVWNDKQTGERKEATEWHNVVFPGKLAEIAAKYLKKGSKIYVEGSLRTRSWEKDGVKRYMTEIRVSEMQMLDGKPSGQSPSNPSQQSPGQRARTAAQPPVSADAPFEEDDIPF